MISSAVAFALSSSSFLSLDFGDDLNKLSSTASSSVLEVAMIAINLNLQCSFSEVAQDHPARSRTSYGVAMLGVGYLISMLSGN
ncbi:hypothetical protein AB1N83_003350 [Pleurotus pulmonarius]